MGNSKLCNRKPQGMNDSVNNYSDNWQWSEVNKIITLPACVCSMCQTTCMASNTTHIAPHDTCLIPGYLAQHTYLISSLEKLRDEVQLHARFVNSGSNSLEKLRDEVQLHAHFVNSGSNSLEKLRDEVQLHACFVNTGSN